MSEYIHYLSEKKTSVLLALWFIITLWSVNAANLASADTTTNFGPGRLHIKHLECDFGVEGIFKRTDGGLFIEHFLGDRRNKFWVNNIGVWITVCVNCVLNYIGSFLAMQCLCLHLLQMTSEDFIDTFGNCCSICFFSRSLICLLVFDVVLTRQSMHARESLTPGIWKYNDYNYCFYTYILRTILIPR